MISGDTPASRGWVRETLESGGHQIWESGETFPEVPEGPAFLAQEPETQEGVAVFLETDLWDEAQLHDERVDKLMETVGGDPEAYRWLVWLGDGIGRTRERITEDPPKGYAPDRLQLWVWIPNDMMSEVGAVIENLGFEPDWQRVPSGGIMIKFGANEGRALQELHNKLHVPPPPDESEPTPEPDEPASPEPEEPEEPAGEMLGSELGDELEQGAWEEPETAEIGPEEAPAEPEPSKPEPEDEANDEPEPDPAPEPSPAPPPPEEPSWRTAAGVMTLDSLFILGPSLALLWPPAGLLLALGVAGWGAGLTRLLSGHARHDQALPHWWWLAFLPFPWTTRHLFFRNETSHAAGMKARLPTAGGMTALFLLVVALTATGGHQPFTATLLAPISAWGTDYLSHAQQEAEEGFGITKVVNATASVVRNSPVPGLDLALGERLAPMDDAAQRLASGLLFGFAALFLLDVLGTVATQIAVPVLVPIGLALALAGAWLPRSARPRLLRLGGHVVVAAILLRLVVPAVGMAGAAVDHITLAKRHEAAMAELPTFVKEPAAPDEAPGGADTNGLEGEIQQLEAASRDTVPALRELTLVLLVRTLVIPLLVLWAFLRVYRHLTRPDG